MVNIDDITEFATLAGTLPAVSFTASGVLHPRISLFAATGTAAEVEAVSAAVDFLQVDADLGARVARADADLRLYELDIANPSAALGSTTAARTIAYGMMAIEPGPDLFAIAALGGYDEGDLTGDPLEVLATSCSRDICAMLGALMAARMAQLPVIIDGFAAMKSVRLLHALNPTAVTHCATPMGSAIEAAARDLGLTLLRCNDARPLYALADAILHAKSLGIGQ